MRTALLRMGNTEEGTTEMQVFQRLQAEDARRARAHSSWDGCAGKRRCRSPPAITPMPSALLQRALVLEPTSPTSHLDLGLALLESGQAAAAVERLTTAAALNAPFDVHRHLARAYAAQGQ